MTPVEVHFGTQGADLSMVNETVLATSSRNVTTTAASGGGAHGRLWDLLCHRRR